MNSVVLAAVAAALTSITTWVARARHDDRLEALAKPLATLCFLALALSLPVSSPAARFWFALALGCCVVGDVLLLPRFDRFVGGLGAFAVGHVFFSVGALALGFDAARLAGLAAVGFGLAMAVLGTPILVGAVRRSPRLRKPVTTYLVVTGLLVTTCWGTGRPLAALGATVFAASDAVLGWNRFVKPLPWAPVVVMVTYHGALAALVLTLRA